MDLRDMSGCMRWLFVVLALTLILACRTTDPCPPELSQRTTPPLISQYDGSPCVRLAEVRADTPPPDLYKSAAGCMIAERYAEATELGLLAVAFVRFDALRHPGIEPRNLRESLEVEHWSALPGGSGLRFSLYHRHRKHTGQGLQSKELLCAELARIGPPTYEASYLDKFLESCRDLDRRVDPPANFDRSQAWRHVLAGLGICAA